MQGGLGQRSHIEVRFKGCLVHCAFSELVNPNDGIKTQIDIVAFFVSFGGRVKRGRLVQPQICIPGAWV